MKKKYYIYEGSFQRLVTTHQIPKMRIEEEFDELNDVFVYLDYRLDTLDDDTDTLYGTDLIDEMTKTLGIDADTAGYFVNPEEFCGIY